MSKSNKIVKSLPKKVTVDGIEQDILNEWEKLGVYDYDSKSNKPIYSIDTPPPTVSGSLHVGHVFSYTHTDLIARYKRMCGFNVFYPMGFDDNGLPTERRVQNYFWVRPDLSASYIENYKPKYQGTDGLKLKNNEQDPISRQNFIELCNQLSSEDENKFKELWQRLGISVDWNQTYQTINNRSRRIAQKMFLRNLSRGEAYQKDAPGLWDVTFQTAVAQAELEAREYPGNYHALKFDDGKDGVIIETTRPELLISCVALIAHPDDKRYQHLFGKTVKSPIFKVEVPVLAHNAAEMDKGAGIAMCCTFGDQTDIEWWRDLNLPMRSVMGKNGRLQTIIDGNLIDWISDNSGKSIAEELNGKTAFSAREIMVKSLQESGDLIGEIKPTTRMTNFYEKGDKPLEIVASRQWYISNGGKDEKLNQDLLQLGEDLDFIPEHMRQRYRNWVEGLNNDWLISRQRFFGVAFPIWYKVDENGNVNYNEVIVPDESILPIDPVTDVPAGFEESQRDQPNGFSAEKDVMDTWATSSLTPQIACGFDENDTVDGATTNDDWEKLYPMSLRPQGQDIIRTWLFSTVVRSWLEEKKLPWAKAALSGWILDPDHKKMSKSKGNVSTPMPFIEKYGADAVRYWAASAKLGMDATFKIDNMNPTKETFPGNNNQAEVYQMKVGRKVSMKLLNATKFALSIVGEESTLDLDLDSVTNNLDQSILGKLNETIISATDRFEKYDHAGALEIIEHFFWNFCDNYVELVKVRAYSNDKSAKTALAIVLDNLIRLFAPFMPYAAEVCWGWFNDGSVHNESWPTKLKLEETSNAFDLVNSILEPLRKIKGDAKVSPKTPLKNVKISLSSDSIDILKVVQQDVINSCNIQGDIEYIENDELAVCGELVQQD
ncbi:MAG: valine--tRNA ligase [Candidatus Ancillula sp.]|jgi:valyl-tRNA synthetase|nr:valine--tRNA ligase [Candidatus Ancillula sp.]